VLGSFSAPQLSKGRDMSFNQYGSNLDAMQLGPFEEVRAPQQVVSG
jgi:hypothetical protein